MWTRVRGPGWGQLGQCSGGRRSGYRDGPNRSLWLADSECGGWDSNRSRTCSLVPRCARPAGFESIRTAAVLAVARTRECGGWDSNPRTPAGADLKSAAFGLAQPPPRASSFRGRTVSGFVSDGRIGVREERGDARGVGSGVECEVKLQPRLPRREVAGREHPPLGQPLPAAGCPVDAADAAGVTP